MASPVVVSTSMDVMPQQASTYTVPLPSGVQAGDLVILFLATGFQTLRADPSGWTRLLTVNEPSGFWCSNTVLYRVAAGSETSVIVDLGNFTSACSVAYRITGADVANMSFAVDSAPTTDFDPPALTPPGGSKDYLWLATCTVDGFYTQTFTGPPDGFTDLLAPDLAPSASSNINLATAQQSLTASTLDPAPFKFSSSTPNATATIAIPSSGPDLTPAIITSSASVSNEENFVLAHQLTANEAVTWSIVGGVDQSHFELSGSILRWVSNGTKDFENPTDTGADNSYVVTVRATDAGANTTDQTITVTVIDGDETPPVIMSSNVASVNERAWLKHQLFADEPIETWAIIGGSDQSQFEVSGSTLRWVGNGVQDYETPLDADGNNTYVVTVRASDFRSNYADQTITITVTDVVDETQPFDIFLKDSGPVFNISFASADEEPAPAVTGRIMKQMFIGF